MTKSNRCGLDGTLLILIVICPLSKKPSKNFPKGPQGHYHNRPAHRMALKYYKELGAQYAHDQLQWLLRLIPEKKWDFENCRRWISPSARYG